MYWAYSITFYCAATYREYHIWTVKFVIHNHFHHFQYLYIDYWTQADAVQSLNVVPSKRCFPLILRYSRMPCYDYLKMVGMDEYATLKM